VRVVIYLLNSRSLVLMHNSEIIPDLQNDWDSYSDISL